MIRKPAARRRQSERLVLVALLNGVRVGNVYQNDSGTLRFEYLDEWRSADEAYPLSLSMPLTAPDHPHEAISAFLWGLLPDNERTLNAYGKLFGVSAGSAVQLLKHIGADCAGAVQLVSPENADELERGSPKRGNVTWLTETDIAAELKSVRQIGVAGTSRSTIGQFSLAGAQPKIALLEDDGKWGRPSGRIPTNRILKPPSGDFAGFAENEHFCLELAAALQLGAVQSRIARFGDEVAIVVDRFDRAKRGAHYTRIHQEDICQALAVMPNRKYQNEGGPGIREIVALLREASTKPEEDIQRYLQVTALNWVLAATDAHAKNYALLHAAGAVRLAPFYDMLSYLPYTDAQLRDVKLAMRVGSKYLVRRVGRVQWLALAKQSRLSETTVLENVLTVLERLPAAVEKVSEQALRDGLDEQVITRLRIAISTRVLSCVAMMAGGNHSTPTRSDRDDA